MQKTAALLIRQDTESRRVWKQPQLFQTPEDCVQLSPFTSTDCGPFGVATSLLTSIKPIPEVYTGIYGPFLQVQSEDGFIQFTYTTPAKYRMIRKRAYQADSSGYFWLQNGHLVIPDKQLDAVTISGMFTKDINKDSSKSMLDTTWFVPETLQRDVLSIVTQDIAKLLKSIPADELPNLNSLDKTNDHH